MQGIDRNSKVKEIIEKRVGRFKALGKSGEATFDFAPFLDLTLKATMKTELAFCLSTANSSAISGLKFQKLLENKRPEKVPIEDLKMLLKLSGVRFYDKKALFIKKALNSFHLVKIATEIDSQDAREFLAENVKGLGYKEASHFLRNIGRKDIAIIDRHILKFLLTNGYLHNILSNITPKEYRKIEMTLKRIGLKQQMNLAELDLYLWHKTTGKVLK